LSSTASTAAIGVAAVADERMVAPRLTRVIAAAWAASAAREA
jgi:hypothetical protein